MQQSEIFRFDLSRSISLLIIIILNKKYHSQEEIDIHYRWQKLSDHITEICYGLWLIDPLSFHQFDYELDVHIDCVLIGSSQLAKVHRTLANMSLQI